MIHSYKNAKLELGKYEFTGISGESTVTRRHSILAESVDINLDADISPNYVDGKKYAEDYRGGSEINGSLSVTYYLTGSDLLRDFFSDDSSRISGDFGGLSFQEGRLSSYAVSATPNTPIKVNAEILFYDQLSGTFTPTDEIAEEIRLPNFYNFGFTNNSKEALGDINILGFNYSMRNELTPVVLAGATTPEYVIVGRKEGRLEAEIDIISGVLPFTGTLVDLSLDLNDIDGTNIFSLPITGVLTQRNVSTSQNDIVRSNISILTTQVGTQSSITSFETSTFIDAEGNNRTIVTINGDNLGGALTITIGDTTYTNTGNNLTTGQLTDNDKTNGDVNTNVFTIVNNPDGTNTIVIITAPGVTTDIPIITTVNGTITTDGPVTIVDGGMAVTGISPNPAALESYVLFSGSGLHHIDEVYFGAAPATEFSLVDTKLLSVRVPRLAESGAVTVKSSLRDVSGVSDVTNDTGVFIPIPEIIGLSMFTGTTGTPIEIQGYGLDHVTGVEIASGSITAAYDSTVLSTWVNLPDDVRPDGPVTVYGSLGSSGTLHEHFHPVALLTGTDPLTGDRGDEISLIGIGLASSLLWSPDADGRYLVQFQGSDGENSATGLFELLNGDLTGQVPLGTTAGLIQPFKDDTRLHYSEASLSLTTQSPTITGTVPESGRNDLVRSFGSDLGNCTGLSLISEKTNSRYEITGNEYFNVLGSINPLVRLRELSYFTPDEGHNVIVTKYDGGEVQNSGEGVGFYYMTEPSITSQSTTSGILGDRITLEGTGFYTNNTKFYFRNATSDSYLMHEFGSADFLNEENSNTGVSFIINEGLSFLFDGFRGSLITGNLLAKNNYGTYTGSNFDIIVPPFVSGFGPISGQVGDTINVTGHGFLNVSKIEVQGYSNTDVPTFSVTNPNTLTFDVPNGASDGPIMILATGGQVTSNGIFDVKVGNVEISGFDPQPAFVAEDIVTITGTNLNTVQRLNLTGLGVNELSLTRHESVASVTGFITGENSTSGIYIQFIAPHQTLDNYQIKVQNPDEDYYSPANFRIAKESDFLALHGYSGFYPEPFTGLYSGEMVISGSGFLSTNAVILFPSGTEDITVYEYFSGEGQQILSDSLIKLNIPFGINDVFPPIVSGEIRGKTIYGSSPESDWFILPTITGISETGVVEGGVLTISGQNNASMAWQSSLSGGYLPPLNPYSSFKDDLNESLGINATDYKIGISGETFDGVKTVEYIANDIEVGEAFYGQSYVNDGFGNLSFDLTVSDRFFGTGRLFLVDTRDNAAIFSGDEFIEDNSTEFFANATGFDGSMTAARFNDLLFNTIVRIDEKRPVISGFSPIQGTSGTSISMTGEYFRGVTGIITFTGVNEAQVLHNTGFTSQTASKIVFDAAAFDAPSGRFRLLTNSYQVESSDDATGHFTYVSSAEGFSYVPSSGVRGDIVTINASAGLNSTTEVRFVTTEQETVTGSFTVVSDTQVTVTVPSEGRLPGQQVVSLQTYNDIESTHLGDFDILEGGKDIFGDVQISGVLTLGLDDPFSLPNADGSNNQVLRTNGAGVATWQTIAGGGSSDVTVTGSPVIASPDFTGVGGTTVIVSGSQVFIDSSAGGGATNSDVSITGSAVIAAPDFTGVGGTTVIVSGSQVFIDSSAGGGATNSDFSVTGSIKVNSGDFTGLGAVTVSIDGTSVRISGEEFSATTVTGSPLIFAPDFTGVGGVTVELIGSTVRISGDESAGGGASDLPTGGFHSDVFSGDGSTTIFELTNECSGSIFAIVSLDGLVQTPSGGQSVGNYNIYDKTGLRFSSAPAFNSEVEVRQIGAFTGPSGENGAVGAAGGGSTITVTGGQSILSGDITGKGIVTVTQVGSDIIISGQESSALTVTGSINVGSPDFTGVGGVTVELIGSTVRISGDESAGGGTPGGSDTHIQFNANSQFVGIADFSIITGGETKIGIGTANPTSSLDVTGLIKANNYNGNVTASEAIITSLTLTSGTLENVKYVHSAVANTATQTINFDYQNLISITLSRDTLFQSSNRGAGKNVTARILAGAANRTLTFDSSIVFVGSKPTGLLAGKIGILNFTSFGGAETDTVGAYEGQL